MRKRLTPALAGLSALLAILLSSACGGGGNASVPAAGAPTQVSIGETLFNDPLLSAGGKQSCASCHTTPTAHADPAGTALPMGGPALDSQGFRSSPTLMYLANDTPFHFDAQGRPVGGFTWDGRADSRQTQAAGPLLDGHELANASASDLAQRLRQAAYFPEFARLYGLPVGASDEQVFDTVTLALATYESKDPDYLLFNSKFDRVLDGTDTLTAQEENGLRAFNDPARGNCASCHPSRIGADGSRPVFTDFGYAALGLPRNPAILANADPQFYDLGLCGPKRTDLSNRPDLCGQFKTPTLRNIALTAPYFHNAVASTLEEAVSFFATRDTDPAHWYPVVEGSPDKYNDLPLTMRGNAIQSAPFGPATGDRPRLNAQDVADLVAFLKTLTDDVAAPAGNPKVGR